jgi:prepilin-type N-terminal cleavage/methylation domain-containing protein
LAGFTLIELLVAISILSLLLAIMMPALKKGRELARRAQCAAQMRIIGSSTQTFAADNEGRAPRKNVYPCEGAKSYGDNWRGMLNAHENRRIFDDEHRCINETLKDPGRGRDKVICPSLSPSAADYAVPIYYSEDVAGGAPGKFEWGSYGKKVADISCYTAQYVAYWAAHAPYKKSCDPNLTSYYLGADLSRFYNHGMAILAQESEGDATLGLMRTPAIGHEESPAATFGKVPGFPLCALAVPTPEGLTGGGPYAYRHMAAGCFTYLDGHVGMHGPMENIHRGRCYAPDDVKP